jgi:hypothetical protein
MPGSGLPILQGLSSNGDNLVVLQRGLNSGGFCLPPGVWPYHGTLTAPPMATAVTGAGSYHSVLQQMQPGASGLTMTDGQRLMLSGVGITGPGSSQGSTSPSPASGVQLRRVSQPNTALLFFEDVVIQQFPGDGIDASVANVIVSKFSRVVCESLGGSGFSLSGVPGGSAGTSCSFDACYAVACKQAGFSLAKMCYTSLAACAVDSSGAGYVFEACEGIGLTACGAESLIATGSGILTDGTAFRVDDCDGVDFGYGCWNYANSHYVLHVSGNSRNIRAGRIGENTPLPSALGHTLVDSGSQLS